MDDCRLKRQMLLILPHLPDQDFGFSEDHPTLSTKLDKHRHSFLVEAVLEVALLDVVGNHDDRLTDYFIKRILSSEKRHSS